MNFSQTIAAKFAKISAKNRHPLLFADGNQESSSAAAFLVSTAGKNWETARHLFVLRAPFAVPGSSVNGERFYLYLVKPLSKSLFNALELSMTFEDFAYHFHKRAAPSAARSAAR